MQSAAWAGDTHPFVQPGDKTAVIGKNGENIKAVKTLVKRYFKIEHVRLR